jgi:hypothetical protein
VILRGGNEGMGHGNFGVFHIGGEMSDLRKF